MYIDVNSPPQSHWDYVSYFESFDYVNRIYQTIHGVRPKLNTVRAINASFAQGRMYFDNAKIAAMGVKPLLLYYGAMSLCAGLILCRDKDKTEINRKHSHGLTMYKWKEDLRQGIARVLQLRIRATSGTFRDLTDHIWNKQISLVLSGRPTRQEVFPYTHNLGPVQFPTDGSTLTLAELISRSRYAGIGYSEITGDTSRLHRASIQLDFPKNRRIKLYFPLSAKGIPQGLKGLASLDGVEMEGPDTRENILTFPRKTGIDPDPIPVFHYEGGHYMSVAEDFPNGDRPTEFLKLYMIAYTLGMLARYFPSLWMSLIRNDEDGIAQPLLIRATKAIEDDFLKEFSMQLAELKHDVQFFGEQFGEYATTAAVPWRR